MIMMVLMKAISNIYAPVIFLIMTGSRCSKTLSFPIGLNPAMAKTLREGITKTHWLCLYCAHTP